MSNFDVLVDCELDRHDWSQIVEAHGPATNVPVALRQLLASTTENDVQAAYWRLENHAFVSGGLFEAALPLVSALLAALVDFDRPHIVRGWLLELLFQIVNGYSHADERARGRVDLDEQCREAARGGLWLMYRLFQDGFECELTSEIIRRIDPDKSRLSIIQERNAAQGRSFE
ncbi:MAG TPA: hypothetical protein VHB77_08470 [Planctomycetaceae bacterium]|nr:hypothetical protein [Planctomycetaceae bacterium]